MKNKPFIIIILLILFAKSNIVAQTIDQSLLTKYPPAILNRLSTICNTQYLTVDKQNAIAALYEKEDKDIADILINKKSNALINNIRNNTEYQIQQLLSTQELSTYKTNKYLGNANGYAQTMAIYYLKKYHLDSVTYYRSIYNQMLAQGALLLQPWANNNKPDATTLNAIAEVNDTKTQKMLYEFEGMYVFNKYVDSLNKIKPLKDTTKARLQYQFLQLAKLNNHNSYYEHFYTAMRMVLKDTAYFGVWNKAYLQNEANAQANLAMIELSKRKQISKSAGEVIRKIMQQKYYTTDLYQLAHPDNTKAKIDAITSIQTTYDSLIKTVLYKDGVFDRLTITSTALRFKTQLALSDTLIDTLVCHAVQINNKANEYERTKPWAKYESFAEETADLDTLLTEDQRYLIAQLKNAPTAEETAVKDWQDMNLYGIATGLDSLQTVLAMKNFHTIFFIIKDKYGDRGNWDIRREEFNALDATIPAPLAKLRKVRVALKNEETRLYKEQQANGDKTTTLPSEKAKTAPKTEPIKNTFRW